MSPSILLLTSVAFAGKKPKISFCRMAISSKAQAELDALNSVPSPPVESPRSPSLNPNLMDPTAEEIKSAISRASNALTHGRSESVIHILSTFSTNSPLRFEDTHRSLTPELKELWAQAHFLKGSAHIHRNETADALKELGLAEQGNPLIAKIYQEKAKALIEIDRKAEALLALDHALSLEPNLPFSILLKADLLLEKGEMNLAVNFLTGSIDHVSNSSKALLVMKLARVYREKQNLDLAIEVLTTSERSGLKHPEIPILLARMLFQNGKVAEAMEIVKDKLKRFTGNPILFALLTKMEFFSGRETRGYLRLEHDPANPDSTSPNFFVSYQKFGDKELAYKLQSHWAQGHKEALRTWLTSESAAQIRNRYPQPAVIATAIFAGEMGAALKLSQNWRNKIDSYYDPAFLALVEIQQGNFQGAGATLRGLPSNNPFALWRKAQVALALGDRAQAIHFLLQLAGPSEFPPFYVWAVLKKLKDEGEAVSASVAKNWERNKSASSVLEQILERWNSTGVFWDRAPDLAFPNLDTQGRSRREFASESE